MSPFFVFRYRILESEFGKRNRGEFLNGFTDPMMSEISRDLGSVFIS